jgi:hypothetical protein
MNYQNLSLITEPEVSPTPRVGMSPSSTPEHQSGQQRSSKSQVVKLNVGGCKFTTARDTLCRVPGSHLEAMFSGRHAFAAFVEDDGAYFLDRDGTHFRHVLNFLRSGTVISLPTTDVGKEELAIEADYYGLDNLVNAIRMPKVDLELSLSAETLSQREEESTLRTAFANHAAQGFDPYRCLVPLFCPDNGPRPLPLTYEGPTIEEEANANFMGGIRSKTPTTKDSLPVTVQTFDQFESNFNREHPNVLHRLREVLLEEPVIIAGGSVLRALTGGPDIRTGDWWGEASDIDLFFYCSDALEANRIAQRIFYALAVDLEKWIVVRSRGVLNIHSWDGGLDEKIQIVLRLYDSPTEVLFGFDVDCCCCAFDGRNVWLTKRCISALRTGTNILNPLHAWPNKASYELRLAKYALRGFAVSVPGIDKTRIDYDRIHLGKVSDLKGMARFLKVTSDTESALPARTGSWQEGQWECLEGPRTPRLVQTLKAEFAICCTDDERLVNLLDNGYDDTDAAVCVPSVYCPDSDEPHPYMWFENWSEFPLSINSRDAGWMEILDFDDPPEGVPSRLENAWDTEKRSREYLNGSMDKYDLDNLYYAQAYKETCR